MLHSQMQWQNNFITIISNNIMKIYTKKGDQGETSLIGGTRISKAHLRIDAYGTVDELNSYIGWVRDLSADIVKKETLIEIQDRLFTIGSHLAADPVTSRMSLPLLKEEDIVLLENEMDEMEKVLPEMKSFILPGGHQTVSCTHVARCVCRRAERLVVLLDNESKVEPLILKYLNRLSDYLFVLARFITLKTGAEETPWKAKM
jgi:cob(I)alamin adenosyltransferase